MAITPDTKDWTWVLERRCEECGFEAPSVGRSDIARMIREDAQFWNRRLTRDDVGIRPRDDMWSPLGYGCHVRDVYRICDGRLVLMLTEEDPVFANWDQDVTAVDDAYASQDPQRVRDELVEAATAVAERFDAVEGDEWTRAGTRSDGAHFTVESFGRYVVHDPFHHVHDVGV